MANINEFGDFEQEEYWYSDILINGKLFNFNLEKEFFFKHSEKIEHFKSILKDDVSFIDKNIREDHVACALVFDKFQAQLFIDKEEDIYSIDCIYELDEIEESGHFHYLSPFMKNCVMKIETSSAIASKCALN